MSELDQMLRALNHPLRRRVLRELVEEPRSANVLSKEFRIDLGTVSYHLNQVLARDCDLVDLVDEVRRRGALEKFYTLRGEALKCRAGGGSPGGKGAQITLEECILGLVVGVIPLPEICPPGT